MSLPEYFAALNKDFRYQLTAIGEAGPNLHIAEEISNNQFKIAGGEPEMEVSWQITGIRKDKAAEANRVPVEQEKPAEERGLYWHPEAHGQPEERGVLQARYGEPRLHAEEQKQQIVEHKRRLEAQRGQLEVLEPAPNPPSVT